jgi:hypothetical protein
MEKKKAMTKNEMIQLYVDQNVINPSDQALGRFARSLGYGHKRVMVKGKIEVWYVLN